MKKIFFALAITSLAALPAFASDQADVMATVNQFVEGFNKGDMDKIVAVCADQMSIIDEFSPNEWHGAGAIAQWLDAYAVDAEKNEITEGLVTLGKTKHLDVASDHAYVVALANYTYKKQGKQVKESGSIFTLTLRKSDVGWRLTGWAWAKN